MTHLGQCPASDKTGHVFCTWVLGSYGWCWAQEQPLKERRVASTQDMGGTAPGAVASSRLPGARFPSPRPSRRLLHPGGPAGVPSRTHERTCPLVRWLALETHFPHCEMHQSGENSWGEGGLREVTISCDHHAVQDQACSHHPGRLLPASSSPARVTTHLISTARAQFGLFSPCLLLKPRNRQTALCVWPL